MMGMALDSIQRTTRTTLNTSLGTKGSQKSSFLEVSPFETNPSNAHTPTPPPPTMTLPATVSFYPPYDPTPPTRSYNPPALFDLTADNT